MFLLEGEIGVTISEELEQSIFDCLSQYRLVFIDPKITEISVRPRHKSLEITHMGVTKELLIPPSKYCHVSAIITSAILWSSPDKFISC